MRHIPYFFSVWRASEPEIDRDEVVIGPSCTPSSWHLNKLENEHRQPKHSSSFVLQNRPPAEFFPCLQTPAEMGISDIESSPSCFLWRIPSAQSLLNLLSPARTNHLSVAAMRRDLQAKKILLDIILLCEGLTRLCFFAPCNANSATGSLFPAPVNLIKQENENAALLNHQSKEVWLVPDQHNASLPPGLWQTAPLSSNMMSASDGFRSDEHVRLLAELICLHTPKEKPGSESEPANANSTQHDSQSSTHSTWQRPFLREEDHIPMASLIRTKDHNLETEPATPDFPENKVEDLDTTKLTPSAVSRISGLSLPYFDELVGLLSSKRNLLISFLKVFARLSSEKQAKQPSVSFPDQLNPDHQPEKASFELLRALKRKCTVHDGSHTNNSGDALKQDAWTSTSLLFFNTNPGYKSFSRLLGSIEEAEFRPVGPHFHFSSSFHQVTASRNGVLIANLSSLWLSALRGPADNRICISENFIHTCRLFAQNQLSAIPTASRHKQQSENSHYWWLLHSMKSSVLHHRMSLVKFERAEPKMTGRKPSAGGLERFSLWPEIDTLAIAKRRITLSAVAKQNRHLEAAYRLADTITNLSVFLS